MNELSEITDKIVQLLQYDPVSPLIFSSGLFLFLFGGFTFFYQFMRRDVMLRIVYVTLFSLYFYYKTSGFFFLLLIAVSVSDFLIGKGIARSDRQGLRKGLLVLSVALDIGLLVYFKYTNFFIGIVNGLSGHHWLDFQNIFLRRIEPLGMWIDYIFFLSFFPQLVAGPIVRARDFIPQIRQNPLTVTREMFGTGIFLILSGLFKKAIISDYISLNFVDRVFDDPLLYSGFENLMGLYGYALQIYCDFSGYSDMAIGIALLLGFHFNKNFDSPYKSATITEFWRRWHISLSSWLKDYLYISLGGNRKGHLRTYLNLIVTMLLGGLWHGAAWRFVLWGGWHGASLAVHKWFMAHVPGFKAQGADMPRWRRIIGIVVTFHVVCFGWIMFRATDLQTARNMLSQIFTDFKPELIPQVVSGYAAVMGLMAVGYLLHLMPVRSELWAQRTVTESPLPVKVVTIAVLVWAVMLIKSAEIQPFIYFQF